MRSHHRRLGAGRAWRVPSLLVLGVLVAATAAPVGTTAQDPAGPGTLLVGPNGNRSGVALAGPTRQPDPASLRPLDTYGREPRLVIISTDADETFASWAVVGVPTADPGAAPVDLASGIAEVPLESITLTPPAVGDWLVTASLTSGTDATRVTDWAWRVVVPDRTLPESIPTPDLVLLGASGTITATRGSVCFLGDCGDIGRAPTTRSLPLLRSALADEPITLTVSDGSAISQVFATALRLRVDETRPVVLLEADLDPETNVVRIPSPGSGRWRLELLVGLADGRGQLSGYARLAVSRP